ncbi:hypothetical protein SDC9_169614 [bioreactor metagenome]|uniref:Uncharacterized protein n=1 Tax=bioreactor metagenome TaxID=1076179 RepID=A0A645G5S5_9ZZZZ
MMTPYYQRTSAKDRQKLSAVTELATTVDFVLSVYQKK